MSHNHKIVFIIKMSWTVVAITQVKSFLTEPIQLQDHGQDAASFSTLTFTINQRSFCFMNILAIGMGHFCNMGQNQAKMAKWAKNRQKHMG